jgi:cyclopropane fatty-acyl-phospholipid synthase-like methyltransferase
MEKPFWERSYREDSVSTFGENPNRLVGELWESFEKDWAILDVGCGEGKNPLFLAQQGFADIDAFDISSAGIAKLQQKADRLNFKVKAWVQDLTQFSFSRQYDLILSHGTLHFVTREQWRYFLDEAKRNTRPGGLNIIGIFTNRVPASPDIAPFVKDLAEPGELESLYRDWEIVRSLSYVFEDQHPGTPKHLHAADAIAARKR